MIEKHKWKPILVLGGVASPLKTDKHDVRTDDAMQDKFMKFEDAMILHLDRDADFCRSEDEESEEEESEDEEPEEEESEEEKSEEVESEEEESEEED